MKVILRQALIAIYVATTVVALVDFFIWMANNGQPAPETRSSRCRARRVAFVSSVGRTFHPILLGWARALR
jgi:hypothetical protein